MRKRRPRRQRNALKLEAFTVAMTMKGEEEALVILRRQGSYPRFFHKTVFCPSVLRAHRKSTILTLVSGAGPAPIGKVSLYFVSTPFGRVHKVKACALCADTPELWRGRAMRGELLKRKKWRKEEADGALSGD